MPETDMAQSDGALQEERETVEDEEREDYLDYCAAAEAMDEALETGEITPLEDFINKLGLEKDCGSEGANYLRLRNLS
jgi:hypothetical protein